MRTIVVDAYNYILTLGDRNTIAAHDLWESVRHNLWQRMVRYSANTGNRIILVYDNKSNYSSLLYQKDRRQSVAGVTVIFSQPPATADDQIVAMVQAQSDVPMTVVTSDEALIIRVRAFGIECSRVYEFQQEEERIEDQARERLQRVEWLSERVLAERRDKRRECVLELAALGYPPGAAIAYVTLLQDDSYELRVHGIRGLLQAMPEAYEDQLERLLHDANPQVVLEVVKALKPSARRDIRLALLETARSCPHEDVHLTVLEDFQIGSDEALTRYLLLWYFEEEVAERAMLDDVLATIDQETLFQVGLEICKDGEYSNRYVIEQLFRFLVDRLEASLMLRNLSELPTRIRQHLLLRLRKMDAPALENLMQTMQQFEAPSPDLLEFLLQLCDVPVICTYVKEWKSLLPGNELRYRLAKQLVDLGEVGDFLFIIESFPGFREKTSDLVVSRLAQLPLRVHEVAHCLQIIADWEPITIERFIPVLIHWLEQYGSALPAELVNRIINKLNSSGFQRVFALIRDKRDLISLEGMLTGYSTAPPEWCGYLVQLAGMRQGRQEMDFLLFRLYESGEIALQAARFLLQWPDAEIIKHVQDRAALLTETERLQWFRVLVTIHDVAYLAELLTESPDPLQTLMLAAEHWAKSDDLANAVILAFRRVNVRFRESMLRFLSRYAEAFSEDNWHMIQQWAPLELSENERSQLNRVLIFHPAGLSIKEKLRIIHDRNISWNDKVTLRNSIFTDAAAYDALFGDIFRTATGKFRSWLLEGLPDKPDVNMLDSYFKHRNHLPQDIANRFLDYFDEATEPVLLEITERQLKIQAESSEDNDMSFWGMFWCNRLLSKTVTDSGRVHEIAARCIDAIRVHHLELAVQCTLTYMVERFEFTRFEQLMEDVVKGEPQVGHYIEALSILKHSPFIKEVDRRWLPRIMQLILSRGTKLILLVESNYLNRERLVTEEEAVKIFRDFEREDEVYRELFEVVNLILNLLVQARDAMKPDAEFMRWLEMSAELCIALVRHPRYVKYNHLDALKRLVHSLSVLLLPKDPRLRMLNLIHARYLAQWGLKLDEAEVIFQRYLGSDLGEFWVDWVHILFTHGKIAEGVSLYLKHVLQDHSSRKAVEDELQVRGKQEALSGYNCGALVLGIHFLQQGDYADVLVLFDVLLQKYPLDSWRPWLELMGMQPQEPLLERLKLFAGDVNPTPKEIRESLNVLGSVTNAVAALAPEFETRYPELSWMRMLIEVGLGRPERFLAAYQGAPQEYATDFQVLAGMLLLNEGRFQEALAIYQQFPQPMLLERLTEMTAERLSQAESLVGTVLSLIEQQKRTDLPGYVLLCIYRGLVTGSYRTYWDRILFRWPLDYGRRFEQAYAQLLSTGILDATLTEMFSRLIVSDLRADEMNVILTATTERMIKRSIKLPENRIPQFLRCLNSVAAKLTELSDAIESIRARLIPAEILDRELLRRFQEGKPTPPDKIIDVVKRYAERHDEPLEMLRLLELLPTKIDPALKPTLTALKHHLRLEDLRALLFAKHLDPALARLYNLIGPEGAPDREVLAIFHNPPGVMAVELHRGFLESWSTIPNDQPNLRHLLLIALENQAVELDLRLRVASQWLLNQIRDDVEVRAIQMKLMFEKGWYFEAYYAWIAVRRQSADLLLGRKDYAVVPLGVVRTFVEAGDYRKAWRFLLTIDLMRYLQTESGQLLATYLEYQLALQETDAQEKERRLNEVQRRIDRLSLNPNFKEIAAFLSWNINTLATVKKSVTEVLQEIVLMKAQETEVENQINHLLKPDPHFGGDQNTMRMQREIEQIVVQRKQPVKMADEFMRREIQRSRPPKRAREALIIKIKRAESLDEQRQKLTVIRQGLAAQIGLTDPEFHNLKDRMVRLRNEMAPLLQRGFLDLGFVYESVLKGVGEPVAGNDR